MGCKRAGSWAILQMVPLRPAESGCVATPLIVRLTDGPLPIRRQRALVTAVEANCVSPASRVKPPLVAQSQYSGVAHLAPSSSAHMPVPPFDPGTLL